MSTLRFGILGSGFMGRTHAEALRQLAGQATLVAVAGGGRAAGLAADFGMAAEPSAEVLLARPDVDAVVITTPHHLHADAAVLALKSGKHVLVEKPLATTVADADRMLAAARSARRVLATAYHQRFRTNNRAACELLRQGALGPLETVSVSMPSPRVTGMSNFGSDWAWWNDPASVGHMINSLPHGIDLLRWALQKEIGSVTALCRTFLPGIAVEDTTLALAEFTGGPIASFYSSRNLPGTIFPGEGFRFRIVGRDGLMDLDPYADLKVSNAQGTWRIAAQQPTVGHESVNTAFGPARMKAYVDQMTAFIAAASGGGASGLPPVGSGEDGQIALSVCCAMLESSRDRRWIDLPAPARQA